MDHNSGRHHLRDADGNGSTVANSHCHMDSHSYIHANADSKPDSDPALADL